MVTPSSVTTRRLCTLIVAVMSSLPAFVVVVMVMSAMLLWLSRLSQSAATATPAPSGSRGPALGTESERPAPGPLPPWRGQGAGAWSPRPPRAEGRNLGTSQGSLDEADAAPHRQCARGWLARPASSVALLPHDGCGSKHPRQ